MQYRRFGRTDWQVSEIGYGMWGMAGWTGSDDDESLHSLDVAVELGCNFFDTAWGYGAGKSEQILGQVLKRHPEKRLYTASKIPPKNFTWPSQRGFTLDECFPPEHIVEYVEKTLQNIDVETLDLIQFHVWEDAWAQDERWQDSIEKLKQAGKIQAVGISINRWEPDNSLDTIRSGRIDAVQVIYNIFDQNPEDRLFPLCQEYDIGVIARVPFDEGTLTGTFTKHTTFPADDWRSSYFVPENLESSVEHADALKALVPPDVSMPEIALRFILCNKTVSTTIPGMRKTAHVRSNIATSDGKGLAPELLADLKTHRWDRKPTEWSQ
ncbi:aldo/keto reductase [candidate division KSB3 bacterium]|uniref:Aldo/keto reductase n=1 Tax=candidate division KSB3 bacterium TaxID=2044937 RepID=A0A2G6E656_9BACT|nr:MAG: aldo/keto reductase [candidate division KSB3 bacterium]PIE30021.1 MAG: aldo/keto reductase [candidate division KSB3 bacterium]